MYVIHVEDRFEPNAGYQINELIKEQSRYNYKLEIITSDIPIFSEKETLLEQDDIFEKKYGCHVTRLTPIKVIANRFYFKDLFKILDEKHPDIVFLHGICDFKDFSLLQKKKEYLIYRDCHMSWVASRNKFAKVFANTYSKSLTKLINKEEKYKKIYALGKEEQDYLSHLNINNDKIELLPHGYNPQDIFYSSEERDKIRNRFKIDKTDLVVGYVGKIDKYKQPDLIFDILKKCNQQIMENIHLLFIGNILENYKELFWNKYEKFPYKNKCIFLRSQKYEDLYKYFSAMDICFWPRETTLSSIHAQVCHCIPIMEDHESNEERVIISRSLYRKNDLNDAYDTFLDVVENIDDFDFDGKILPELQKRNYVELVKKLNNQWSRDLKERGNK